MICLVLACLLPGVIGASVLFVNQYREGRAQQERDTIATARALVQTVDSLLRTTEVIAQALSTHEALLTHDHAKFYQAAQDVLARSGMGSNIVVRDESGQQIINTAVELGQPLARQPISEHVHRVFSTGKPNISDLFIGLPLKRPIMSVNVPVIIDGKVAYVLGVGILPAQFNAILNAQNLPPGWVAAVFDSSGTIVGRNLTPEQFIGNKVTAQLLGAITRSIEGSIESTTQEGTPVISAYSRSRATNWGVAIGIPRQSQVDALVRSLSALVSGVATLFGIGLMLAWLTGDRIARSVRALTAPAVALGSGGSMQAPHGHITETAEVGMAINRASMLLQERSAALQARETELAQAHRLLRNVVDSSPALIYLNDLNGHLLLVNKMYERLIGDDPDNVRISSGELQTRSHRHGPSAADIKVLESGGVVQFEEEINTVEGVKHFAVSKGPLRNPEGKMIGICAAAVDITSLKVAEAKVRVLIETLENRVRQRTQELNQANAQLLETNTRLHEANDQLEAFSYTVAHDLRAPLRGIQGFADAVSDDYADKLDETGRDYLSRISRAAARMERLIDDLLSYSRLSRMELALGTVSLDEVFGEVMANLSTEIADRGANVVLAPNLPCIRANKTACIHIFQNLLSNALKFSRNSPEQHIQIWSEVTQLEQNAIKMVRIWVEDNGIGIQASQVQRIFKPFERLHGISEYPGSGIGLAVVDTTVRRMHGRCGVMSEINVGSRFWVELPAVGAEN